jgi:hypothetical protein
MDPVSMDHDVGMEGFRPLKMSNKSCKALALISEVAGNNLDSVPLIGSKTRSVSASRTA